MESRCRQCQCRNSWGDLTLQKAAFLSHPVSFSHLINHWIRLTLSILFTSNFIYNIDTCYLYEAQIVTELCRQKHWPRKTVWVICIWETYITITGLRTPNSLLVNQQVDLITRQPDVPLTVAPPSIVQRLTWPVTRSWSNQMLYILSQFVRSHLTTTLPHLAELDFLKTMYHLACSTPWTRNSLGWAIKY